MVVGSLIGKLFGGDANKNEASLRAYGKLPMYAEYRRLEISPGTPTAYSQWLDAGRLAWCNAPTKSDSGQTRTTRLLIGLPDQREAIVATVWDSRDSLGRVFPFSFFVVCPIDALGETLVQRWVSAMGLHQRFAELHRELSKVGQGGDFYRHFQKRTLPLRPENMDEGVDWLAREGRGLSAEDWYRDTIGSDDPPAGEWFAGLLRRVERWNAQPKVVANLALNCPLAAGGSLDGQVAAWLQLLEGAAKQSGKPFWVIMPGDGAHPPYSLNLLTRDLLPDDFQLMTTDDSAYNFVERLASIPQNNPDSSVPKVVPTEGSFYDWLANHATR